MICGNSWSPPDKALWTFCVLGRGHPEPCKDWRGLPKPDNELFYSEQPKVHAELEKQIADDRKREAKKAS